MASYTQARSLLRNSVSRKTLYSLNIFDNGSTDADKKITPEERNYIKMFASRVTLPHLGLDQVTSIGQEHMGIQRNTAAGVKFGSNELNIQVIESADFTAYKMMRKIFNNSGVNLNPTGIRTQRMKYYDNYVFNMELSKLELPSGSARFKNRTIDTNSDLDFGYQIVSRYKFEKCYISRIGELLLDSAATDSYLDFPVSFAFESYHHDGTNTLDQELRDAK